MYLFLVFVFNNIFGFFQWLSSPWGNPYQWDIFLEIQLGTSIRHYHAGNRRFQYNAFMKKVRDKWQINSFYGVNAQLPTGKLEKGLGTYKSKSKIKSNMVRQYGQAPSSSPFGPTQCGRPNISQTAYRTKNMVQFPLSSSQDSQSPLNSRITTPFVEKCMDSSVPTGWREYFRVYHKS